MTLRTGAPGFFTDSETSGSARDPQLPWGSCCIRKTFWRLPMHYSDGTGMPIGAERFQGF